MVENCWDRYHYDISGNDSGVRIVEPWKIQVICIKSRSQKEVGFLGNIQYYILNDATNI